MPYLVVPFYCSILSAARARHGSVNVIEHEDNAWKFGWRRMVGSRRVREHGAVSLVKREA